MIWTIIELEEDNMVLTKFHKLLVKAVWPRQQTSLGVTYLRMYVRTDICGDGRTGIILNALAIVMAGA